MKSVVKVGIVGFGYWGPNLARNFQNSPLFELVWICDRNPQRLSEAITSYPHLLVGEDLEKVLRMGPIDLVVIATPPETHFRLASQVLEASHHILIEKPMTLDLNEDLLLISKALARNVKIFIDHTFLFTPAIRKLKELNYSTESIISINSNRVNLGLIQDRANVVWDLAIHDLSILLYLMNPKNISLRCFGFTNKPSTVESQASLHMIFDKLYPVNIYVSWQSLIKKRTLEITYNDKMVIFDDLQPTEKIKIYEGGAHMESNDTRIQYRLGDIWAPYLENKEALKIELTEIYQSLVGGAEFVSDGVFAHKVNRVIEACNKSLLNNGSLIELELS